MKVLITGQRGQLAQALSQALAPQAQVLAFDRHTLDLTQPEQIRHHLRHHQPDLIINAAAYTAVDKAEQEPERAFAVNAVAPGLLAEEAARLQVPLIHYSTDYVFDGQQTRPYTEQDPTHPLNIYGQSKRAGELAIQAVGGEALILRTSWVYSRQGNNFLLTMQRLLQERPQLRVVDDQHGAPTWTGTLAKTTVQLIQQWQQGQQPLFGLYHLTAQGETSWYGFAQRIRDHLIAQQRPCAQLQPIPARDYPTPAQRPLNSRLDCTRLQEHWQLQLPPWQEALQQCLTEPTG